MAQIMHCLLISSSSSFLLSLLLLILCFISAAAAQEIESSSSSSSSAPSHVDVDVDVDVVITTTPTSTCYVFDEQTRLLDFSDWVGRSYEYRGGAKDWDLVVRFCRDVELRSNKGYLNFGHFGSSSNFVLDDSSSTDAAANFIQEYYGGDLLHCEHTFDKMGRTAQVNLKCGTCSNQQTCEDKSGCICNVTYDETMCRVLVDLAIQCPQDNPVVFDGFTVGFHPRTFEVVYNGMTQPGFDKIHHEFSFATEHMTVPLYISSKALHSQLVGKPRVMVLPEKGLEVDLSGTGANGAPPTTLSPSVLNVHWRCERNLDTPYEVAISIPVKGYRPIKFSLSKLCAYKQQLRNDGAGGWATFGIFSCLIIVISTAICCAGFLYNNRVNRKSGLEALPGITFIATCLETVSVQDRGYQSPPDTLNGTFTNQPARDHLPFSAGAQRAGDQSYGSI